MSETIPRSDARGDLAQEVLQLLVAMSRRLSQHFATRAAEFDLSTGEGKVLLALGPDDTIPMRALARRLGYDASNLTGIIDKLEDRGAIERRADPTDRRVKSIATTEQGLLLRESLHQRLLADAGPVKALTGAQLLELRELLQLAMADERAAR